MSEIGPDERGLVRNREVLEHAVQVGTVQCSERLTILVSRGYRDGAVWYQLKQLQRTDTGWAYADRSVYLPASAVGELVALLRGGGEG